jgi:hypothetical protein
MLGCIKEKTLTKFFLNVELTCNDQVFFEILKMKIRSISISHSIAKTREEKDLTLKLEKGPASSISSVIVFLIKFFFSSLQKYCEHFSPFSCQFAFDRRSIPSTFS